MSKPLKLVDELDMPPSTLTVDPYTAREFGNEAERLAFELWEDYFNIKCRWSNEKYSVIDFMGFGSQLYVPHFVQVKARSIWSTYFGNYMLNLKEYDRLVTLQDITKFDVFLFVIYTDKAGYIKIPVRPAAIEERQPEVNKLTNSFYFPVSYFRWIPDDLFRKYFPAGWWKMFLSDEKEEEKVVVEVPDLDTLIISNNYYDWRKELERRGVTSSE